MLDARNLAEAVRTLDGDGEVSESTVHYYTQVGILPPALNRGRNGFTPEHLARFRLARRLKRDGESLATIRKLVTGLDRAQVQRRIDSRAPGRAETVAPHLHRAPSTAASDYGRPLVRAHLMRESVDAVAWPGVVQHGSANPPPSASPGVDPMLSAAMEATSGGLPRSLRFSGGFALQCPQDAPDELVARLYSVIEGLLEKERNKSDDG